MWSVQATFINILGFLLIFRQTLGCFINISQQAAAKSSTGRGQMHGFRFCFVLFSKDHMIRKSEGLIHKSFYIFSTTTVEFSELFLCIIKCFVECSGLSFKYEGCRSNLCNLSVHLQSLNIMQLYSESCASMHTPHCITASSEACACMQV